MNGCSPDIVEISFHALANTLYLKNLPVDHVHFLKAFFLPKTLLH